METLSFTDSRPTDRGAPVVVLLHGLLLDSRIWLPTMPFLTDYRVIAIDLPGHGGSRGHAARTLQDWVLAAAGTLDCLGVTQPVLVGNSAGAIVALELAFRRPDLAAAAVLLGCFGHATVTDAAFQVAMADFAGALRRAAATGDLGAVAEGVVPSWPGPHAGTLVVRWLLGLTRLADPQVVTAIADDLLGWDPRPGLPGLTVPATWVLGEHETIPQDVVHLDATMSSGGRFITVPGSGHLPQMEVPALAAELIADAVVDSLPMAAHGLSDFTVTGLTPYRGFGPDH